MFHLKQIMMDNEKWLFYNSVKNIDKQTEPPLAIPKAELHIKKKTCIGYK